MFTTSKILKKCLRHFSSITKNDVVIAAAVRAPISSYQNTTLDFSALTINSVIKQAALPKEHIEEIYLVNKLNDENVQCPQTLGDQLKKGTSCQHFENDAEAIYAAFNSLQSPKHKTIIVAAVSSTLGYNFDQKENVSQHLLSMDEEIISVTVRQKDRSIQHITKDEFFNATHLQHPIYTATAMAIMTANQAEMLNIKPLARLKDVEYISKENKLLDTKLLLEQNKIGLENIKRWDMLSSDKNNSARKLLIDTNEVYVNKHDLAEIISNVSTIGTSLSLTHLVHSLKSKGQGYILSNKSLISIEKMSNDSCDKTPHLTLYTKDPCPLCDELIEELEEDFKNEYSLDKVFIDQKENVRFLRLFRYDIPVLFLNGQFLCMHRLNKERLRRRLNDIKGLANI